MAKKATKKSKKEVKKENYFKGVKKEMQLVKWPDFKSVVKNTVATVCLCLIIAIFFILLTLCLSLIKGWIS